MRRNNSHNRDDNNDTNISSLGDSHREGLRRNMPESNKEMKEEESQASMMPAKTRKGNVSRKGKEESLNSAKYYEKNLAE